MSLWATAAAQRLYYCNMNVIDAIVDDLSLCYVVSFVHKTRLCVKLNRDEVTTGYDIRHSQW